MKNCRKVKYLIAFDNALKRTEYSYKEIIKDKELKDFEDGNLIFKKLSLLKKENQLIKGFQQRNNYLVESTIPLDLITEDELIISTDYKKIQRKQLQWFKAFVKKRLNGWNDILFVKVYLDGNNIAEGKLTEQVEINELNVEKEEFSFHDNIYQFVDSTKIK